MTTTALIALGGLAVVAYYSTPRQSKTKAEGKTHEIDEYYESLRISTIHPTNNKEVDMVHKTAAELKLKKPLDWKSYYAKVATQFQQNDHSGGSSDYDGHYNSDYFRNIRLNWDY